MCRWTEADFTREVDNSDLPLDRYGNVPDRIPVLVFPNTPRTFQEGYFNLYPFFGMFVDAGYGYTAGDSAGLAEGPGRPGKLGALTGRRAVSGMSAAQWSDAAKAYLRGAQDVLDLLGKSWAPMTPWDTQQCYALMKHAKAFIAEVARGKVKCGHACVRPVVGQGPFECAGTGSVWR